MLRHQEQEESEGQVPEIEKEETTRDKSYSLLESLYVSFFTNFFPLQRRRKSRQEV